jgi:hypothetical protein
MQTIGGYSYAHYLIGISYQVFIKKVEVMNIYDVFQKTHCFKRQKWWCLFSIIETIYTYFLFLYCQMKRTNALLVSNLLGIIKDRRESPKGDLVHFFIDIQR